MFRMLQRSLPAVMLVSTVALSGGYAVPAAAQNVPNPPNYPSKSIRMILPFTGGGDILARPLAQMLTEALGQSVYVENIVGGQTIVGTEAAARAPGDGHTILMITNSATINQAMRTDMRFDLLKDFVPITQLCTFSLVLVSHPGVPADTLPELIALARSRPGQVGVRVGRSAVPVADGALQVDGRRRHPLSFRTRRAPPRASMC